MFSPDMRPVEELSAGQVGYITAAIKRVADAKVGETITDALRPTARGVPRLPRRQADGVRRPLPDRGHRIRRAARRAREASPERSRLQLRAGDLAGPRLRLPLRLPRHAAHGDRPGAAGARVQPVAHHHGAVGAVPHPHHRRRGAGHRQPVEAAHAGPDRADGGAVRAVVRLRADRVHDGHLQARPGEAGRAQVARVRRQARAHPLRLPAGRDRRGLLRQAEVDLQGLRLVRLRVRRLHGRPTWSSSTSSSTATPSTRSASSCTATRPTSGARRWSRSCAA